MKQITPMQDESIQGPLQARPAFVSWLAGGRQDFPTDRFLDRVRTARLKALGLIKVRRIPVAVAA